MYKKKIKVLMISTLLALSATEHVQGSTPLNQSDIAETFSDLKTASESLPEFIKPSDTKNMAEFCQVNGYRDRIESFYWYSADQAFPDFGWENSFYATLQTRVHAFLLRFSDQNSVALDLKTNPNDFQVAAWNKLFKRLRLNAGPLIGADQLATLSEKLNSDNIAQDQDADFHLGLAQAAFVCSDLTFRSLSSCIAGLDIIQKISKPVSTITMLPLWIEVARDPVYINVFRKISNQIALNIYSGVAPKNRFFDDLMAAFLENTKDTTKALDYTWKTLALLSSAGGNTFYRPQMMTFKPMNQLADLIWIMTMGPMTLDRLTYPYGYLYSYPKEINTVCDYGKNYHFWMTAYLAREVVKATHDITGSAAAAYTAEKGYQFAKKDGTRDPSKPFTQDIYSDYNNNIRLDLSLSAAGAWFGAQSLTRNNYLNQGQIDQGILFAFSGSQNLPRRSGFIESNFDLANTKEALALYSDWKKILNADGPFKFFEKQITSP